MLPVLLVMLPAAVLLVVFALLIRFKKAYYLISGYNTMPPAQQEKVDKEKMGRIVSDSLFAMALLMAAGGLLFYFKLDVPALIALGLILPVSLYTVIASQKCTVTDETDRKNNRVLTVVVFAGVTLLIAGVFSLLFYGSQPPRYVLEDKSLRISGMYGTTLSISDVTDIELEKNLPENLSRRNGLDFAHMLKGRFLSAGKSYRLFVNESVPAFIYLQMQDVTVILNTGSEQSTRALYEKIKTQAAQKG